MSFPITITVESRNVELTLTSQEKLNELFSELFKKIDSQRHAIEALIIELDVDETDDDDDQQLNN